MMRSRRSTTGRNDGEQTTGFEREVYLDCDGPRDTWVTELQVILAPKT